MIDTSKLDTDLRKLIETKSALNGLGYDSEEYDLLEEELHDLEDRFIKTYGNYLEEALHEVHDEYCPDNDVLLPTAYIPNHVVKQGEEYSAAKGQGIYIEADDYDSSETKLVLLPSPIRIELLIDSDKREVVWQVS